MHATSAGCRPSYPLVVMAVVGVAASRVARLDVGRARALVELVGMLVYIRLVPRLIPVSASARTGMPSAT